MPEDIWVIGILEFRICLEIRASNFGFQSFSIIPEKLKTGSWLRRQRRSRLLHGVIDFDQYGG